MKKEISKLQNNIEYIYKQNKNTPRMAFCLNFAINKPEIKAGVYSLMTRLLFQGTKNYTSEALANEFEKYAIDFSCDQFTDYLRVRFVCLNEDFEKAVELTNEVLTNSTFEEFEKEQLKLKCELPAELDSPRVTALDAYCDKLFENHYYGNSINRILNNIDSITKEEILEAYNYILNNSRKTLAIVGALDKKEVIPIIEKTIGKLPKSVDGGMLITKPQLTKTQKVENIRTDLNQAHIIKGWMVDTINEKDYPALVLLNIILGSCGLSSRLFTELRDKKGLAYVVRSNYETFKLCAHFMIYIATEPKNIEISLKGFDEEIEKIKTIPVSEKELENAKNNLLGKCAFVDETNLQQAYKYAKNGVLGLGFDYSDKMKEAVKKVSADEILQCAQKYFNDTYVLSVIKP
ncbi:MAG: M16 family metallopeptidase [Candidatus Gastranaerophilaceae bacterium]